MLKGDWLPKTVLVRNESKFLESADKNDNAVDKSFRGGGITLTPLEPMRKWRIQFDGSLRNSVRNCKSRHYKSVFFITS